MRLLPFFLCITLMLFVAQSVVLPANVTSNASLESSSRSSVDLSMATHATVKDNTSNSAITFTGPAFPHGEDITFTGTAKAIHDHLRELNPNYDEDFKQYFPSASSNHNGNGTKAVKLGSTMEEENIYCDDSGVFADIDAVYKNIDYLGNLLGGCKLTTDSCTFISCSWNAAVYVCGGLDVPTSDVSCRDVAEWTRRIANLCIINGGVRGYAKPMYDGVYAGYDIQVRGMLGLKDWLECHAFNG
ncbi:uncharacterized protein BCR38DRAFT_449270 [Pseudomassariella vexata]|uniref:Uncharacterized protein n=1 Tax=Pseudomassariella vexata TaxID=1141098 RepID=A0A1Y2DE02_9PEZI|nr:uncharacterized protein BCR38DRAFT_449270 [Pseudomassariella vexata]ORY57501.1 hypothetical protein BCR38DRAFT_449270 [Pseudomassariella vexata]